MDSEEVAEMANVDPVVLAVGVVREITRKEFVNRDSGEVEDRGHVVTVLTRVGFLQFNLPLGFAPALFEVGSPCVAWLRYRSWEFNGRQGVTLVFDSVASAEVAEAFVLELASA
jgi:hypothetical protein